MPLKPSSPWMSSPGRRHHRCHLASGLSRRCCLVAIAGHSFKTTSRDGERLEAKSSRDGENSRIGRLRFRRPMAVFPVTFPPSNPGYRSLRRRRRRRRFSSSCCCFQQEKLQ
ncbi:hypothetical protein TIFTF001_005191 [Ficus carica]|uniref:Uncharacterized protein n=1 Tax=Ficus carica TaxID=3494 RepID=A0AA88CUA9_FICCA|nr:hypothetical protein TIFTF001_005191 [Ficus carica]